jgi:hypothetical protein
VFIPSRYLAETSLLSFGARAEYEWYLRFPDSTKVEALAKTWRTRVNQRQLSLRTASDNEENLRSSLDQLGRCVEAVDAFETFLDRAPNAMAEARSFAATRLSSIEGC